MEIVIAAAGMPFGPNTLEQKSLGGSETAVICMARELRKRKHVVTVFAPLPEGIANGMVDELGIRWINIKDVTHFIAFTDIDLLVVSRNAEMYQGPHQAKKAVLWVHDLATHNYTVPSVLGTAWNFHEVWTVSEFHRQQWHKVTGYPLERIKATRNGIARYETIDLGRVDKQLLYAARPERGLENLVRPGGIMSKLPDYKLLITMYDNFPEHMKDYYNQLWSWARQLPNVEFLGPKSQAELRQLMRNSWAYVYPTEFEEVSCIIGRECIEQRLPIVATKVGALEETLGNCAAWSPTVEGDDWTQQFVDRVIGLHGSSEYDDIVRNMEARTDLYWDEVAAQWESWAEPPEGRVYSRAWSLVQDSDVIAAKAYLDARHSQWTEHCFALWKEIDHYYPYLSGREGYAEYYERYYRDHEDKVPGTRSKPVMDNIPRYEAIYNKVKDLPRGSTVLDYGCAEGVISNGLAKRLPHLNFVAIDFSISNIELAQRYAAEDGLENIRHMVGSVDNWSPGIGSDFDMVLCSEVLEHVEKPWELAEFLEKQIKIGGTMLITVPAGPWELTGLHKLENWEWRAHIWHINKWMLRKMFADKEGIWMANLTNNLLQDGRALGHLVISYTADHKPIAAIDPLEKALQHRARQTVGCAIIARDSEATLLRTLQSLGDQVCQLQVAIGPSTDNTCRIVTEWGKANPWVLSRVAFVPAVEPNKFGFDDARNESIKGMDTDWILWIDSDEYLSGHVGRYARDNAFDAMAIHQHHFTLDPRGTPAQLDKPARMYRNNGTFNFYGKVHEHAEKGPNGGPGFCYILPDVDIGHIGYVNEDIRRARFFRNLPLLKWDREVNPDRKLGKFLWLRDLIHQMRYAFEQKQPQQARLLAEEAVDFFRTEWKQLDLPGMGGPVNALAYYSEAMAFLGRGLPIELSIRVDRKDPAVPLAGLFANFEELSEAMRALMAGQFERRNSKYFG